MAGPQRSEFSVPLHDLRRFTHSRREVVLEAPLDGVTVADTTLDTTVPVAVSVVVESVADGVTATGVVRGRWHGACNLCLDDVGGELEAQVSELFADRPVDEDTYRLDADHVDLEPMVRDALLLELPLLARCPFGGVGSCDRVPSQLDAHPDDDDTEGDAAEASELADPRWAALDALDFGDDT